MQPYEPVQALFVKHTPKYEQPSPGKASNAEVTTPACNNLAHVTPPYPGQGMQPGGRI